VFMGQASGLVPKKQSQKCRQPMSGKDFQLLI
jgi:hypothetical protein